MTDLPLNKSPAAELPEPTRARWQPLRLGLVELYHYDVEEFRFRDGHLLLRGNNGTGKSKVLSLTLPFLLDGQASAARVEPDGDRHKRMEWNLLMGGRYDKRTGYTWMELGRLDETGNALTVTIGCGLRAIAGRAGVDTWFFVTDQRVGRDLWLVTPEQTALSQERLTEAIGARGQVFKTAQAYRRAVDERLFGLGEERYEALVETLIQLRQPQLSKQPNEDRLSAALTEALAPLDRVSLESVADAMGQLEDLRRELDELGTMRRSVAAFGARYLRYAQIAARRKARVLRQSQTDFDNASRELNAAERALERAREKVTHWRTEEQRLDEHLTSGRSRLGVLEADPVMRDARRLVDARAFAEQCRTNHHEAEQRMVIARDRAEGEQQSSAARRRDAHTTRTELAGVQGTAVDRGTEAGIAAEHTRGLEGLGLPDGVAAVADATLAAWPGALHAAAERRRQQIEALRKCLRELHAAEQRRQLARSDRDRCADAFDAATVSHATSAERRAAEAVSLLAAWRTHFAAVEVLEVEDRDTVLAALESWTETQDGTNPARGALDAARMALERVLAAREAAIAEARKAAALERGELEAERARLVRGEDRRPPIPYTRDAAARERRTGAPLWQAVDFAAHLAPDARAGIEAALEAAGLLDAWLAPDGTLTDARTHDTLLVAREEYPQSLADWLVPTIPEGEKDLSAATVSAVLRSIACTAQELSGAETWVSPHGEFRVGAARGAWSKPKAAYVGHAAREAARRARLVELEARLAELAATLADCDARQQRCEALRADAAAEVSAAPSDDALLRATAGLAAAEQQRRFAQVKLGEAEVRLSEAAQAAADAHTRLISDARDLQLPSDESGIGRVEHALAEYRTALVQLAGAVRNHRRSLLDLAEQERREATAATDVENAATDRAVKATKLLEADAIAESLEATVGKQVGDLLGQIEAVKRVLEADEKAAKAARAQLNAASGQRGTAESERNTKEQRLTERVAARKAAVTELESFAAQTGLLAVALGAELEASLPAAPWSVDAALTLARRAEQALADISADDGDWSRVQSELSRDLTELQSAMSAHGHSATAELTDQGLIVRIVHQQRPVRPDVLERQLDAELGERKLLLSVRERDVLEQHLEKEIAANLQRMIKDTDERVAAMNRELERRPTSTGVRYRLVWQPLPEDSEHGVPGLAEARKRLLRTSAEAWSPDDRRQVGDFLQRRIAAETSEDDHVSVYDSLARALDYRRWHQFRVQRYQDGQWRPLAGPASSGERALGLTVPLFAACSVHYESAREQAPRLVLLDEAFAGIDDEARANCMALISEFDLDFVMTSEREWGCYPELPGLSICQLVRREGVDAVFVSRWTWDGRVRRENKEIIERFPSTAADRADSAEAERTEPA